MKNFFKVVLGALSYYALRKVIEKLPPKQQGLAVRSLRVCVFFIFFLVLFAFLSGQISAIARNLDGLPALIANLLLGMAFVVTALLSFLLTSFIEEIYKLVSAVYQKTGQTAQAVVGTVEAAKENVRQSVVKTKGLFAAMGGAVRDVGKALYDTSARLADMTVSGTEQWVKSVRESNRAKEFGAAARGGAAKTGEFLSAGARSAWNAVKSTGEKLGSIVKHKTPKS